MVTIFSKPNCPHCENAKKYLNQYQIPYEVRDITRDPMAHSFVVGNGHRTVPQLYRGDELLVSGYAELVKLDENEIKEKLGDYNVSEFKN